MCNDEKDRMECDTQCRDGVQTIAVKGERAE
jgi:hypothetical protein